MSAVRVTIDQYNVGWDAYQETQTIHAVARVAAVSYRTARRMVRNGYPDRGWDSYEKRFSELEGPVVTTTPAQSVSTAFDMLADLKEAMRQVVIAISRKVGENGAPVITEREWNTMSATKLVGLIKDLLGMTEKVAKLEAYLQGRPENINAVSALEELDDDPATWSEDRLQGFLAEHNVKASVIQESNESVQ